ncbi:hypothetical protein Trydic_g12459 [Trypoxylus dichotomus]
MFPIGEDKRGIKGNKTWLAAEARCSRNRVPERGCDSKDSGTSPSIKSALAHQQERGKWSCGMLDVSTLAIYQDSRELYSPAATITPGRRSGRIYRNILIEMRKLLGRWVFFYRVADFARLDPLSIGETVLAYRGEMVAFDRTGSSELTSANRRLGSKRYPLILRNATESSTM